MAGYDKEIPRGQEKSKKSCKETQNAMITLTLTHTATWPNPPHPLPLPQLQNIITKPTESNIQPPTPFTVPVPSLQPLTHIPPTAHPYQTPLTPHLLHHPSPSHSPPPPLHRPLLPLLHLSLSFILSPTLHLLHHLLPPPSSTHPPRPRRPHSRQPLQRYLSRGTRSPEEISFLEG